jgi:SAM-dependent methyltransferase
LAKHPGVRVLGVEGRQYNIDRAEFVRSILGLENVKFLLVDLEKYDMAKLGRFDVVFCSGILYHLPEPWTLIEGIRRISDKVFIWTHYAEEAKATEVINGYRGWWYQESGFKDPLSGLSPKSFWLAFDSLQDMLRHCGFTRQNIVDKDPQSQPGPNTVIAAWAE